LLFSHRLPSKPIGYPLVPAFQTIFRVIMRWKKSRTDHRDDYIEQNLKLPLFTSAVIICAGGRRCGSNRSRFLSTAAFGRQQDSPSIDSEFDVNEPFYEPRILQGCGAEERLVRTAAKTEPRQTEVWTRICPRWDVWLHLRHASSTVPDTAPLQRRNRFLQWAA
jgi:hypothetical protein